MRLEAFAIERAIAADPDLSSVRPEGAPRLSPLRQYDGGVLYKSPGRSFLEAPLLFFILFIFTQSSVSGPTLEEPALVCRAISAAHCSPVAHSPETRPPLSGKQNDLAPPARAMGSTSLASQWEPSDLPEGVLNTISQARAPSTRRLYALKWSVFSAWCTTHGADPVLCGISLILSFLQ